MSTSMIHENSGRVAVIEDQVDIERPPEEVFDYCSDHTNEREWNIRTRRAEKLTDGPVGLGTRYEMEFIPGHPIVVECVRFERPTGWKVVGRTKGTSFGWTGWVQPTSGGAHLAVRMEIAPRGLLAFAVPLLRRRERRELARDIAAIKARLEGAA